MVVVVVLVVVVVVAAFAIIICVFITNLSKPTIPRERLNQECVFAVHQRWGSGEEGSDPKQIA